MHEPDRLPLFQQFWIDFISYYHNLHFTHKWTVLRSNCRLLLLLQLHIKRTANMQSFCFDVIVDNFMLLPLSCHLHRVEVIMNEKTLALFKFVSEVFSDVSSMIMTFTRVHVNPKSQRQQRLAGLLADVKH